ncbi:pyridoxal-phosphate dependent enzyme [Candidatus Nomurabacteria bacterium]|nr:pyridoxal-phosphate dependent enzyme [Candidatus Nomurabacteria bacterium]
MNNKKVFGGDNAIKDFLTPGSLGMTPVVELPESLNKFRGDKVRIFIKLMQFVPLGNIKSMPSWQMLSGMTKDEIKNTKHLVEYSSGNTVLSLAILSRHFGIPNLHAIITPDVPEHKKRLLKLVGADLMISYGPRSPDVHSNKGGVYEAKQLGKKKGWHNLNQYINPGNINAGEEYVAKELWNQLGGDLTIFASTIGTAGTIYGAGSYLKSKNKDIYVAGTSIKKGSSIPGPRVDEAILKLGIPWYDIVDQVIPIDAVSAYERSLALIRSGLFVGPSTGMQLAMIEKMVTDMKKNKTLNKYRNKNKEVVIAFVACDMMHPYIDDYFSILPKKYFKQEQKLK